jgi:osmoprotectant transport system ATP-binding protein
VDTARLQLERASSIRFDDVSKSYARGEHSAVDHVSLSVEPGDLVVMLGPSGSGKTTLLKLVNRLLEPTGGRVLMDEEPVDSMPAHLLRRRIGYVIQQSGLFPHMRVEENVAVVPRLLNWDAARISRRVDELLDLVGLPPSQYRRRYPAQLSGGEQQRVGLARALAGSPTTLLMDEPFGALDAITRSRLQEELRRIHSQLGQTVLFVTHDVEEAVRLADRIVVMNSGRVVQYDKPSCIVLTPADGFVASLMGSGDVLRRLSLMPVTSALRPPNGTPMVDGPFVSIEDNLRTALSLILDSQIQLIAVVDGAGRPVGTLDLASIHEATSRQPAPPDQAG